MDLIARSASIKTGDMASRLLPLTNTTLSGGDGAQPGTMSADLDMSEALAQVGRVDWTNPASWQPEVRQVMNLLRPGARTIVPVREDITRGYEGYVDRPLGEWMITDLEVTHGDPVVKIRGVELTGYAGMVPLWEHWRKRNIDRLAISTVLLSECYSRAGIAIATLPSTSQLTGDMDYKAGTATYADVMRALQGDDELGWQLYIALDPANPNRVKRTLSVGVGGFAANSAVIGLGKFVASASTPGMPSTGVMQATLTSSLSSQVTDLWAFGAGGGSGQLAVHLADTPAADVVPIGATMQASDQLTKAALTQEATRARAVMRAADATMTIIAPVERMPSGGPRVGQVWIVRLDPSITTPERIEATYRVTQWSWRQPTAGELETFTVGLRRYDLP